MLINKYNNRYDFIIIYNYEFLYNKMLIKYRFSF